MACALSGMLYLWLSYGMLTLVSDNDSLYPFASAGDRVLVHKRVSALKRGQRVAFQLDWQGGSYLATGRVYALGGDVVTVSAAGGVLQTPTGDLSLTPEQAGQWLARGSLPLAADEVLICNENPLSKRPDCRVIGPVKLEKIRSRILMRMGI